MLERLFAGPVLAARWRQPAVLAVLGAIALVSLALAVRNANFPTNSQDFQYSAAHLMLQHVNPYELYPVDRSRFLLTQGPNYLPFLYLLLLPFGAVTWPVARMAWALCNVGFSLHIAWNLRRGVAVAWKSQLAGTLAALVFLVATPARSGIGNGQHALLVTSALIVALQSRNGLLRGAALALAVTKMSLGMVFGGLFVGARDWIASLTGAGITFASFVLFGLMTGTAFGLRLFLGPVVAIRAGIAYYAPLDWVVKALGPSSIIVLTVSAVCMIALWAFLRSPRSAWPQPLGAAPDGTRAILAATLASLWSAPHAYYDFAIVALPFVFGDPFACLSRPGRTVFWALLGFVTIGQKLAFGLLPTFPYELVCSVAWAALIYLTIDCLREGPAV